MELLDLGQELRSNPYPGRGIAIGRTKDGTRAVCAYFIMGRSLNSRNRVFVKEKDGIRTEAFDPSKMEDPSLIIYAPVRVFKDTTIVSNGDQTDTIYEGLKAGLGLEQSLKSRRFEPDAPNFTPRISGLLKISDGQFSYEMSILKSADGAGIACERCTFSYENCAAGEGRFIHTYLGDENPLPSFEGEPKRVQIPDDPDEFTGCLWDSLNEENKVSLFVRFIPITGGGIETRIVNKNH